MRTDITRVPTLDDIYESKDAMDDIQSFTYDGVDTFVDAKGVTRDTVTGRIKKMGYAVPIAYTVGIVFAAEDNVKTVEEAGVIYAPLPSSLPFTTSGTFIGDDDSRFFIVQGLTQDRVLRTDIQTLAAAISDSSITEGTYFIFSDRANGIFDVISGIGTANSYNIVAHNSLSLSFVLRDEDWVKVENYVSDPSISPSAGINAAIANAIATGKGISSERGLTYDLDVPIDFTGVKYIKFLAEINTVAIVGSIAVTTGGFSQTNGIDWEFDSISDGSSLSIGAAPATPLLQINGAKAGSIKLKNCNYVQIFVDDTTTDDISNAYNKYHFDGIVRKVELLGSNNLGWITENTFTGGRLKEVLITNGGGYAHNHNKFYDNTFEGDLVDIQIDECHSNKFYGARCENVGSAPGMSFLNGARRNTMEITWSGLLDPRNEFVVSLAVTDNGMGNNVSTWASNNFTKTPIFQINGQSGWVGSSTQTQAADQNICVENAFGGLNGSNAVEFGFDLCTTGTNRWIYLSNLIPVKLGDVISFDFTYEGNLIRPQVFCYDSNQRLLKDEAGGGVYYSQSSTSLNTSTGAYRPTVDLSDGVRAGAVVRSEVAFIRVGIFSGAGGDFRNLSCFLRTPSLGRGLSETSAAIKNAGIITIAGAPIRGIAPENYLILDQANNRLYRNSETIEDELASSAAGTAITVNDGTGVVDGDIVGLLLDDGKTHWTTVASGGGTSAITLTVAIPSAASTDNRIVFTRWIMQSQLP